MMLRNKPLRSKILQTSVRRSLKLGSVAIFWNICQFQARVVKRYTRSIMTLQTITVDIKIALWSSFQLMAELLWDVNIFGPDFSTKKTNVSVKLPMTQSKRQALRSQRLDRLDFQVEGEFEGRRKSVALARGDRAAVVRHQDNLKMEGAFETKKTEVAHVRGERAVIKKHEDNLKLVTSPELYHDVRIERIDALKC